MSAETGNYKSEKLCNGTLPLDYQQADASQYNAHNLYKEASDLFVLLATCSNLEEARQILLAYVKDVKDELYDRGHDIPTSRLITARDCARALMSIFQQSADQRGGFSVAQALYDLALEEKRDDLQPGFYAELTHLLRGLRGRASVPTWADEDFVLDLTGREAAIARSDQLDELWQVAESQMQQYAHGLQPEVIEQRAEFLSKVLEVYGVDETTWRDWTWHTKHVIKDADIINRLFDLSPELKQSIAVAQKYNIPFGVTPFYLSLFDPQGKNDRTLRAQVLPPPNYVKKMASRSEHREEAFDFMGEHDTSPIDLITRRYPGIVILKPYNTCPQICVYCQRNWEIDEAMSPVALADDDKIDAAIDWIAKHPSIHEVLLTGGDPLVLDDEKLKEILDKLAAIDTVERIRIGSRTLVTLPLRFTKDLVKLLGSYRKPGYREVAVVTHVEHPYELNPEMVKAVDRLRRQGIPVYNQLVYTFFVSRRFEATLLRRLLRLVGIDPYYSFNTKGKEETEDYRVPIARLLQEQKEEARLLPGLARTDEIVYNVPRLGKNHLRAVQHRDLLSILPDGRRLYEFHPWEKNIVRQRTYFNPDVSVLKYLQRLEEVGENPEDYESIWYYF